MFFPFNVLVLVKTNVDAEITYMIFKYFMKRKKIIVKKYTYVEQYQERWQQLQVRQVDRKQLQKPKTIFEVRSIV
jgi:hypothetical protein